MVVGIGSMFYDLRRSALDRLELWQEITLDKVSLVVERELAIGRQVRGVGPGMAVSAKEFEVILTESDQRIVDVLRREVFLVVNNGPGPPTLDA